MEKQAAVISAIIALLALAGGFIGWRERTLRRDDVLNWANESIEALQTLLLVCVVRRSPTNGSAEDEMCRLAFRTSCLVERGRLFFRNRIADRWGHDKPPAYRGYRPLILDQLIVSHQIACVWPTSPEEDRARMRILAEDALKNFVSYLQKEVGRSRTASADTRRVGRSIHLRELMSNVEQRRLEEHRTR
jgi:hypothetical protein